MTLYIGKFVAFEINIHTVLMREIRIERDSEKTYCLDMCGKFIAFEINIHKQYESDSGEDILLRFRALKCCDFI